MTRYVLRRVGLSIVTLFLVVTIVFLINNVFPSDIGRRLAGPFQSQEVVDDINERLGTNDPLIEQYGRMVKGVFTFDWGDSYAQNKPVSDVIGAAFWSAVGGGGSTSTTLSSRRPVGETGERAGAAVGRCAAR